MQIIISGKQELTTKMLYKGSALVLKPFNAVSFHRQLNFCITVIMQYFLASAIRMAESRLADQYLLS